MQAKFLLAGVLHGMGAQVRVAASGVHGVLRPGLAKTPNPKP